MRFTSVTLRTLLVGILALAGLGWADSPAQAAPTGPIAPLAVDQPDAGGALRAAIASNAKKLMGKYDYTWGGGHGPKPGPSLGSCKDGYQGPKKCIDDTVVGFDCSGFARYVIWKAGGGDFAMNTDGFLTTKRASTISRSMAVPGDLILFGPSKTNASHIAIYAGSINGVDYMYEAASHSLDLVKSKVSRRGDIIAWRRVLS